MTPPTPRKTSTVRTTPTTPTASTPTPGPRTAIPTRPIRSGGPSSDGPRAAATAAGHAARGRCVDDPADFLANVFGVEPHLSPGAGSFRDLLSLDDVDRALTGSGLRQPALRLVRGGAPGDPRTYTRPGRTP